MRERLQVPRSLLVAARTRSSLRALGNATALPSVKCTYFPAIGSNIIEGRLTFGGTALQGSYFILPLLSLGWSLAIR